MSRSCSASPNPLPHYLTAYLGPRSALQGLGITQVTLEAILPLRTALTTGQAKKMEKLPNRKQWGPHARQGYLRQLR